VNPYTYERLAEERDHLMAMPGVNKRRDPETVKRLEQIEHDLKRIPRKRNAADRLPPVA